MSQIIGISGRIGSGKDTVCKIIQNLIPDSPWEREWENKKFAYKLKQIASILTGVHIDNFESQEFKNSYMPDQWSYLPDPGIELLTDGIGIALRRMTYREFLQLLGTDAIRYGLHKDTWVNALFADLKPSSNWIITDTRFVNEADYIQFRGGKVIRIERYLAKPNHTSEEMHPSETALDDYDFDYIIENTGTLDQLTEQVRKMLIALDYLPI